MMIDKGEATLLSPVLTRYGISGPQTRISRLGNGLINDTWLVRSTAKVMVLQRINRQVFKQPRVLVENARVINAHLQRKQELGQYHLSLIPQLTATDGREWVTDENGDTWRALTYLAGSRSVEVVDSAGLALKAGEGFGQFTAALADLTPSRLSTVIPDFHNLPLRLAALKNALVTASAQRLGHCQAELALVASQGVLTEKVAAVVKRLPLRITHNDTKINNMLFNTTDDKPLAVIDLDTCMPGYLMFDFGDMVRSACCGEAEDSRALNKVFARREIVSALTRGYLSALDGVITDIERESLFLGVKAMTLMLAVRFLTDYLQGDRYFHVERPRHNLERAQNQLALFKSLCEQEAQLSHYL